MLRLLKSFFVKAKQPEPAAPEPTAPYKIEAPEAVVPAPSLTVDGHGDVHEVKTEAKPKKTPAKKPAATTAPAKPRTPRKPRSTK